MNGEIIKFRATDNVDLEGMLCLPKKSQRAKLVGTPAEQGVRHEKTKTVFVYLHGMGGFFWDPVATNLYSVVTRAGLGFFPFNNRGSCTIRRFNRWVGKKRKKVFAGTSLERFEDCIKDIDGALRILRKKGFRKFILCGHSTGCQKIAYYQSCRNNRAVKGFILLAPADDMNIQKKLLGKRFYVSVRLAKRLVKHGSGATIMPSQYAPTMFNAQRYCALFKPNSVEGNLFNYDTSLPVLRKISVPVLAVFGRDEIPSKYTSAQMLQKLTRAKPEMSTALILGDHSYRGGEKQLRSTVARWLRTHFVS